MALLQGGRLHHLPGSGDRLESGSLDTITERVSPACLDDLIRVAYDNSCNSRLQEHVPKGTAHVFRHGTDSKCH